MASTFHFTEQVIAVSFGRFWNGFTDMDMQLTGKRAFISGSTQGIGYAIARGLLDEGASVTVNGRSPNRLRSAVERLRADFPGTTVSGLTADFGDPVQVQELLDALGAVDILVNNVGLFDLAAFQDVTDEDWHRYFQINVMSGVRLSRHVMPGMLAQNWGRIIFIGSESGVNIPVDMVHYGLTKAGVSALGNGLAKLTRGTDVTVNTILGGPTYSDGVAATVTRIAQDQRMTADALKSVIASGNETSLLQRFIEPGEIADLAVYLSSPRSSATNGAALRADGGVLTGVL
jgi:NAD(P)-dependent dehydrogenase (short-subunit alcohol dehydrogenase family)